MTISLFSIRSNFHRIAKQSVCCQEKINKCRKVEYSRILARLVKSLLFFMIFSVQLFQKNITSRYKIQFGMNLVGICLCTFHIIQVIAVVQTIVNNIQIVIILKIHVDNICHFFIIFLQKTFINGLNRKSIFSISEQVHMPWFFQIRGILFRCG